MKQIATSLYIGIQYLYLIDEVRYSYTAAASLQVFNISTSVFCIKEKLAYRYQTLNTPGVYTTVALLAHQ